MGAGEHERIRVQLGALAVDAVDGPQRAVLARHVARCPACRRELDQLRRVADRLTVLRPDRRLSGSMNPGPRPAPPARRGQKTAAALTAAAAAFVILAGGLTAVVLDGDRPEPEAAAQDAAPVAFAQAPPGVTGEAQLRDWGWGAQLDVRIQGLPGDQHLSVWLEQPDGSRVSAGSFTSTGEDLEMTFGAGAATAGSTALGVSDAQGTTILLAPLPAS